MPGWGVIPSIRVLDMAEVLAFYTGQLEFTLDSGGEGATNSSLTRGDGHLMIETAADFYGEAYNEAIRERLGTPSSTALYIESEDLAGFHSRLKAGGVVRIIDPLASRPWGQEEFTVEDPAGNWLSRHSCRWRIRSSRLLRRRASAGGERDSVDVPAAR